MARNDRLRRTSGFTLNEMLIVVVIVGILASLALLSYSKTIERGYWREAQDLLLTIYSGERAAFFATTEYQGPLDPTNSNDEWRAIYMDDPNLASIPVVFDVVVDNSNPNPDLRTFTATATRTGGFCGDWERTINQDRAGETDETAWDGLPPC